MCACVCRRRCIQDVDSFATQTRYLYPEAGCDFGRDDVAMTRDDVFLSGGQMGKMCIVDGDYTDGPLVLPPCEPGARVRLEFGRASPQSMIHDSHHHTHITLRRGKKSKSRLNSP